MNRLLAIDPDPTILELLKDVLELEGYKVTATRSLDESSEILRRERFDLLLVDYRTLQRWSRHPTLSTLLEETTHSTPIVCLSTAHPTGAAPPAGTRAVVAKPFEVEDLLAVLDEVLGIQR